MNNKRQLKDKRFRHTTIKIDLIREVFKISNGYEYKDKMYCVEINDGHLITAFCEKTLKELFKKIKEEFHL